MWTEEKVNRVKQLWLNEKKSYETIAKILGDGLTANAIAGKINRLHLQRRKDQKDVISYSSHSIPIQNFNKEFNESIKSKQAITMPIIKEELIKESFLPLNNFVSKTNFVNNATLTSSQLIEIEKLSAMGIHRHGIVSVVLHNPIAASSKKVNDTKLHSLEDLSHLRAEFRFLPSVSFIPVEETVEIEKSKEDLSDVSDGENYTVFAKTDLDRFFDKYDIKDRSNELTGAARAIMRHRTGYCKWPIGNPQEDKFCFCEAKSVASKPYCVEHMRIMASK